MDILLERAEPHDAEAFAVIQNAAFYADFSEFGTCPGYGRTPEELIASMAANETYRIVQNGRTVGKLSLKREGEYAHIGCLCISPECQRLGLGKRALMEIERRAPEIRAWELETPAARQGNIRFYEACGYTVTKRYTDDIPLVTLTKYN